LPASAELAAKVPAMTAAATKDPLNHFMPIPLFILHTRPSSAGWRPLQYYRKWAISITWRQISPNLHPLKTIA
jgi:hypothetical protein